MTERWYGPEERWPAHPRDWFRAALDEARGRGWWLMKLESYGYGVVYCGRDGEVDGEPCHYVIFKTATAGEDGAKDLRKLVAKCPHRGAVTVSGAAARLVEAGRSLDAAARLLSAVRLLGDAVQRRARAEELIEDAAVALADADRLLEEAVAQDAAAGDQEAEAFAALSRELGGPADRTGGLDGADERIGAAERGLGKVRNRPEKRELAGRAAVLRGELEDLRRL